MANLQGPMLTVQELASHLGHHSKLHPAHPSPRTPVRSPPNFTLSSGSLLSSQSMDKPVYCFQHPGVASNPDGSGCKLIEYRGAQVAAFKVDGRELICLPQAFDLFLKNLVGGLHTVYTKLKRLDITPVVCNVEQVRILRGLGAIQPGVNRCKLISPREFDVLYDDCTNSSARPGRPPKRSALITPDTLEQLKRSKLNSFSDFYAHNRLIADAKKVLGYGPSAPGHSYLSYIDFKKSAMFGNCYNYAPQVTHLPLMPFGYPHGMMNLAMSAAAAASSYGLGAIHRDDIHPTPSVGGIRNVSVSDAGSPRSVESCPERRIGGYESNNSGVIVHVTDVQRTNPVSLAGRSGSSAAVVESSEKPLNLEVNKPYRGHSLVNEYAEGENRCGSLNGGVSQVNRFDSEAEETGEERGDSGGRREVGEVGGGGSGDGDENCADSDVDSDVLNGDDALADDRFRSAGSDTRHLAPGLVIKRDDDVYNRDLKSERSNSHCEEEEEEEEEDGEEEEEDEEEADEDRRGDMDDISSAFSLHLYDRDERLRSPVLPAFPASAPGGQYSIEALLANIQGLIKMAAENARQREQQTRMEKAILQKRLKKEQETRRVLEERLNSAMKHINIQYHSSSSSASTAHPLTTEATASLQLQDPRHSISHVITTAAENNMTPAENDILDGKPSPVILGHLSEKPGTGKPVENLMDSCLTSAPKISGIEFMNHKDFRFAHDCDRN